MVPRSGCQLYSRPFDERLLKKRLPKLTATYNTVRLLDYLEEKQKLKNSESYMFAKHSTTPWYSQNFIDKQDQLSFNRKDLDHINYENKLKLPIGHELPTFKSPPFYPLVANNSNNTPPKSREARKAVITPVLEYDGFADKQIFSPFNFNWSVRPRLTNKKNQFSN